MRRLGPAVVGFLLTTAVLHPISVTGETTTANIIALTSESSLASTLEATPGSALHMATPPGAPEIASEDRSSISATDVPVVPDSLCGECWDPGSEACEEYSMQDPCHAWEYHAAGEYDRDNDSHLCTDVCGETYIGNDTCEVRHSDCEGLDTDQLAILAKAIQSGNAQQVTTILENGGTTWLEYNQERRAVQILHTCSSSSEERVTLHVPVGNHTAQLWEIFEESYDAIRPTDNTAINGLH